MKIPGLIENIVSGQQGFKNPVDRLPALQHSGGVEKRLSLWRGIPLHTADNPGGGVRGTVDFVQHSKTGGNKVRLEKQILRGIAGEDEFRSEDDFGSLALESAAGIDDLACVAGEVANGRVDLCESDFHELPKAPLAGGHDVNAQPEIGDRVRENASRETTCANRDEVVGDPAKKGGGPVRRLMHQHEGERHNKKRTPLKGSNPHVVEILLNQKSHQKSSPEKFFQNRNNDHQAGKAREHRGPVKKGVRFK